VGNIERQPWKIITCDNHNILNQQHCKYLLYYLHMHRALHVYRGKRRSLPYCIFQNQGVRSDSYTNVDIVSPHLQKQILEGYQPSIFAYK
jgi:hypothetical protein